ncbi:MAG TPA: type II toxin-antitoxin system HicA family toxin [Desulfobacterales bacterium]|nr:type II toxin-antitoxin system HicA family toxin [Desulfobacterales bacterium]
MVRLANISGKKAVRAFMRLGYKVARQTGSHVILRHEDRPTLTIPNHRELAPGLLRSVIRQAGLSVDEFINSLS